MLLPVLTISTLSDWVAVILSAVANLSFICINQTCVRPQAVWKDVSKHKRVAIFSVFAALFLLSSAFGGLGTFTNVREHNGRVSITIGAPHEVRVTASPTHL